MYNLKFYIAKRLEIVAKSRGVTRLFAYGELICFPISVGVIGIVAVHSLLVLLMPLFAKIGMPLAIPTVLPSWFVAVYVSAAIGYLTNYIAVQMLYYPVDTADIAGDDGGVRTRRYAVSGLRDAAEVWLLHRNGEMPSILNIFGERET